MALLHQLGAVGTVVDVTLVGSFLLICTTAGALAAGIPFNWLPAPLVSAKVSTCCGCREDLKVKLSFRRLFVCFRHY